MVTAILIAAAIIGSAFLALGVYYVAKKHL